jgi:UDPglucose 6-dehydrogenase
VFRRKSRYKAVVIGCGKLGAPLAACLANNGHRVTGIDLNQDLIRNLSQGVVTWNEPGLQDLLKSNTKNLKFVSRFEGFIAQSDISFVIVPTPSQENGEFSNRFVLSAVEEIGTELAKHSVQNHVVVIVSTVMPGSTSGIIKETLLQSAGPTSQNVSICYSPEFIALGSVIKNMEYPDIILIGEEDSRSGKILADISLSIARNRPKVFRLTTREAEIAKISINSFVTTKISFSNQISELCENTLGASAENVLKAIGSDTRIGNSYLSAGTGYGGPCFPRDNRAFSTYAKSVGVSAELALATDEINVRQNTRIMKLLESKFPVGGNILVAGLSYKPDTDVVEESPALDFIERASKKGYKIIAVDQNVGTIFNFPEIKVHKPSDQNLKSIKTDAALLFVTDKSYKKLPEHFYPETTLFDFWGFWKEYEDTFGKNYLRFGDYFKGSVRTDND